LDGLTAAVQGRRIVETFNKAHLMATVNFSVPDDVKEQFNRAFARENKSSVIARLMMQAVEERRVQRQRSRAVDTLLKLRSTRKPLTMKQFNRARRAGRP
jgi:predicted TIM-barrel fold metal-dependent hydrolase